MVDTERAKQLHRERQKRYYERHKASASALPSASSGFERKASAVSRQNFQLSLSNL